MEKWNEIFEGSIPQGEYQMRLSNGDENGLIVELENNNYQIIIDFGVIKGVRMLDEGIVQNEAYSETELEKYKKDNFKNIIYKVEGGNFINEIKKIADEYFEILDIKHYVIITQNFNIDIITEWEPDLKVIKK